MKKQQVAQEEAMIYPETYRLPVVYKMTHGSSLDQNIVDIDSDVYMGIPNATVEAPLSLF